MDDSSGGAASPGELILHYKVEERLGAGAMGIVFRAEDQKLRRHVALKFLAPNLFAEPHLQERFLREAMAASALDHPNIGAVHTIEQTPDGRLFIVMPCYEGETLKRRIERAPIPIPEAIDIAIQTARGLSKAHERGIIHRDIKPSNIILTAEGLVKIVDFGLAKMPGGGDLTETGVRMGTAAYMSPEQASAGVVDQRTDIWSLGVVLYEMLRGDLPFRGQNAAVLLYAVVHLDPPPLSGVPAPLEQIVRRCMAKGLPDRYANAARLIADLQAVQQGDKIVSSVPQTMRPTETFLSVPKSPSRKRFLLPAAAGVVLAGAGWLFFELDRPAVPPGKSPTPSAVPTRPVVTAPGPAVELPPVALPGKTSGTAAPKKVEPPVRKIAEPSVYKGPNEGRIVWTGDLDAGQQLDLTAKDSNGVVSGTLPGVPVSVEVHPASVHVVTEPAAGNRWRRLVVRNDGKKQAVIVVNWAIIPQ